MNNRSVFFAFLVGIFILLLSPAKGQVFHVSSHAKKTKTTPYALHEVYEDATGYVWLATDKGLIRYDGRITETKVAGVFYNFIQTSEGYLAVGRNQLIFLVDERPPDSAQFVLSPAEWSMLGRIRSAVVPTPGTLLLGTDNGIYLWKNKKTAKVDIRGFSGLHTSSMLFQRGKDIQYLTAKGGIYRWDPEQSEFSKSINLNQDLSGLKKIVHNDSLTVVLQGNNIFLLDQQVTSLHATGLPPDAAISDLELYDGDLLISTTDQGMWLGKNAGTKFVFKKVMNGNEPHRTMQLPFERVSSAYAAENRNIWTIANGQLWLLKPRAFKRVTVDIPMVTFEQPVEAGPGKLYLDAESALYEVNETAENEFAGKILDIGLRQTHSAIAFHAGKLWISTVDAKIYSSEDGQLNFVTDLGSRGGTIFNLYTDRGGNLWVQQAPSHTPLAGTLKITPDMKPIPYGENSGFKSRMLAAKESPDGNLYFSGIGDESYLYMLHPDGESFINLSAKMDFDYGENFEVHDLAIGKDTTIWLASTAGLLRYKNQRVEKLYFDELDDCEAVGVVIAEDGAVWFGTSSRGVVRYHEGQYAVFDEKAGFATNFMSYRSMKRGRGGSIWAGTREGMFFTVPSFRPHDRTRKPIIQSVNDADGKPFSSNSFGYTSIISFDILSLSYPSETVLFAYRLSGNRNNGWITLPKNENLVLSNLQQGNYTIEIRARQAGGYQWSEPVVHHFSINPVWYLQPRTFFLYILAAGMLTIAGVRIYNRRLIREKEILEKKVTERTKEIAAKNEEITVQNEEIVSQMDEISMQVEQLKKMNDLLAEERDQSLKQKEIIEQQNDLLAEAKNDLEHKVKERTQELSMANHELADHNIQLQQFAFMTAHNLRSPVASLLGLTGIFNIENLSDPFNIEVIRKIEKCAGNLDEIIRDISEILQVKKSFKETFEPVCVQTVLSKVLDSFKADINNKNITFYNHADREITIHGIEPYIYSVFYNVMSNSIKYADVRKKPSIKLDSKISRNTVTLVFSDNGIGFDADKQREKIFKPFSRLNSIAEGKGLGLYLMKIEMDAMHAGIDIQSKPNEGTTVTLMFPGKEQKKESENVNA